MSTKSAAMKAAPVLGAALACTLFAGTVAGKDHKVIVAIQVSTQGLDLSQPAGAHELYQRLQYAAWQVCSPGYRVALEPSPNPKGCSEKALGDAVRSAHSPLLTQVYLQTHTLAEAAALGIDVPTQIATR
jgi:UrcA family protein